MNTPLAELWLDFATDFQFGKHGSFSETANFHQNIHQNQSEYIWSKKQALKLQSHTFIYTNYASF